MLSIWITEFLSMWHSTENVQLQGKYWNYTKFIVTTKSLSAGDGVNAAANVEGVVCVDGGEVDGHDLLTGDAGEHIHQTVAAMEHGNLLVGNQTNQVLVPVILESQPGQGTTVYLALPYTHSYSEEPLQSPVQRPTPFGGFSPALVELSDVLPSTIYDFEDLDG